MVVDLWANILPAGFAEQWAGRPENASVGELFGDSVRSGEAVLGLIDAMDEAGVQQAVVTGPLRPADRARESGGLATEDLLAAADAHPGRLLVSATVDQATRPLVECRRIRELAAHPAFVLVRVTPLVEQYELNHRLYYPVYATCAELGLPVSINVGVPGPRVRSRCQNPVLLEDVLIDFPGLVVIGAHMGHPYEQLLITYMLKWDTLYLSNSAYLASYMDDALVRFMNSSRGRGRVLFASDHPVIPMARALDAARKLPLDDEAMDAFLGGTAARLLDPGRNGAQ